MKLAVSIVWYRPKLVPEIPILMAGMGQEEYSPRVVKEVVDVDTVGDTNSQE